MMPSLRKSAAARRGAFSPALLALLAAFGAAVQAEPAAPVTVAAAAAAASGRAEVGEVILSVGPAVRVSADGVPEPLQRSARIRVGDRLDTAEGGLVHIRFVDGAMVSLRPGSRLWVEDYRYNPAQVQQSLVKFRLDQGVARAISGAAAEGAKERFRLNTPLVAIGVRGTDFVVRSDREVTTASVNQGAIVVAPFGAGCLAQALGPCASPTARELSADMGHLQVEFRPQFAQPEIKPAQALAYARPAQAQDGTRSPEPVVVTATQSPAKAGEDEAVSAAVSRTLVTASAATPLPTVPGDVAPPAIPAEPASLMWGRWADAAMAVTDMSEPRELAREGRKATVGNADYLLYRIEGANATLAPGLTAYDFSLQQAHAQYAVAGQAALPASVQDGRLSIDFANSRFNTALSLFSAPTGAVQLSAGGYVRTDGIFVDRSIAGQAVAGATSLDGKSAGYLFEKAVGAGVLSGITLWSRP